MMMMMKMMKTKVTMITTETMVSRFGLTGRSQVRKQIPAGKRPEDWRKGKMKEEDEQ